VCAFYVKYQDQYVNCLWNER